MQTLNLTKLSRELGALSLEGPDCEVKDFGPLEFLNTHRTPVLLTTPKKTHYFQGLPHITLHLTR